MSNLNELARQIHDNAKAHGWWDEERSFGEIIALCHAELSEALEEYRKGFKPDQVYYYCNEVGIYGQVCNPSDEFDCHNYGKEHECKHRYPKPEGIPIELADTIIRILDYCGHAGIDIDEAIRIKHEYNKTRTFKHGNKII